MKQKLTFIISGLLFLTVVQPAHAAPLRAIRAKACILLNSDDAVVYAKNPSEKLPPASTVKLVTAMVTLDRLDPQTKVTVSRYAAATHSIRPKLHAGDEFTVSDLLHIALMNSVNSAAVALAEATGGTEDAFVALMNEKAQEIGAYDTHFVTASGLPKGRQYTTARDLTIILKKALTYPLIKEIIGKKEWTVMTTAGRELHLANTDALLWSRSDIIGGKTGFTSSARHCFVGAVDTQKGLVYTAVLGAPSRRRLWTSTEMLVNLSENPDQVGSVTTIEEAPARPGRRHHHHHRRHRRVHRRTRQISA